MAIGSKNGTASSTDYVPLAEGIKFLAGETEKEVGLAIIGDKLVEGNETVLIEVMRFGGVIASMTLTILDDDNPSSPSLASISDVNVVEKTGENVDARFRVTVTPPPAAACSVKYATEIGTAGGADFASTTGTLSFAAGQSTADIHVPVFGDAIVESDERFSVRMFEANGVTLSDDRGFATILDDDDPVVRPVLAVDDVVVTESNEQTFAEFTLRLSQATSQSVRISVQTVDGTATVNGDYEHRAVTLTFAPGQTTKTVSIPITGDTEHEETETFTLRLSDGSGMIVPDLQATCTIADDDPARTKRRSARH
jgi:chitinase